MSKTQQRDQIADLILGHAEGLQVSSALERGQGFGADTEYTFEVSNGTERYGVVIILSKLRPAKEPA